MTASMPGMWWVIAVVGLVVLVATYLTWTATRVDRLHARASAAAATLDAHLVRRAVAAVALADMVARPALRYAARIALDAHPAEREAAENDLTRQVRAFAADPAASMGGSAPELDPVAASFGALVSASRRVALARQVHSDAVRDALAVRRRIWVRAFRLARRHSAPRYFDVDDPELATMVDLLPIRVPQQPPGPQPTNWLSDWPAIRA